MESKAIVVLCLFLAVSFATAKLDEFGNEMEDFAATNDAPAPAAEETPAVPEKIVVEDEASQTTALVQQDSDAEKHKGFCHWGIAIWYKPGVAIRCNCMRCVCQTGGAWKCDYFFAYCPYYYCGNQIYNPASQICCCGKVHSKKANWNCCGYFYYNTRASKCCNYFSVKPLKANCPRSRI
ncbi:uncharacterized protein LOC114527595 [Dendronephthya gigantea]|uniref:uncharacterized protein LOC114527595 n=1 Tax=Dendronephthya gigantea TaxID=151771 RepID=UPI001069041A|nr:uncharacterized protein LOC114527595 [Dendronephthya gigantea]